MHRRVGPGILSLPKNAVLKMIVEKKGKKREVMFYLFCDANLAAEFPSPRQSPSTQQAEGAIWPFNIASLVT